MCCEKVLASLNSSGVYLGARIKNIDPQKARQDFLIKNQQFSWAAFNIKGCFVDVELVKTEKKPTKTKLKSPCNIVAKTDGKILKIKAYSGRVSVKIGEAVAVVIMHKLETIYLCNNYCCGLENIPI